MTGRDLGIGGAILGVAAAIACANIAVIPGLIQTSLLPQLGGAAANYPLMEFAFAAIVFGLLIIVALIARPAAAAPGERAGTMAAIGLVVGVGGVTAAVAYAAIAGTLVKAEQAPVGAMLLLLGCGAVAIQVAGEEIFFRGWLQPALAQRWGPLAALIATALAFAGVHVVGGARGPLSLLNLFLGGLAFGFLAYHGRGLAGAAMMHFGWNATEQLVWGLDPNPGVGSFGAIADRDLVGSGLWGGSGEGLNASLGMTFALLAILVPLVITALRPAATKPTLNRSPSLRG